MVGRSYLITKCAIAYWDVCIERAAHDPNIVQTGRCCSIHKIATFEEGCSIEGIPQRITELLNNGKVPFESTAAATLYARVDW